MSSAKTIQDQLTKNYSNNIAWRISFNIDTIFFVKILKG